MNREEWLTKAIEELKPVFKNVNRDLPTVKVSVGWPGGRGNKKNVIGQHWHPANSSDNISQIFISPVLDEGLKAIDTLAHELVHACEPDAKHGKAFIKLGKLIGLEGKPTHMAANESFKITLQNIVDRLGKYPHSSLHVNERNKSAAVTALRKVFCRDCGYTVRVTNKWINLYGCPICPCNTKNTMVQEENLNEST